jgi:hypothetical protein
MKVKVGIVKPVEAVVAMQRHDKFVSAATDTDATVENAMFSMRPFETKQRVNTQQYRSCWKSVFLVSVLKLYTEDQHAAATS